ncbi:MAG: D-glycerate dehydrogenase [Proteobacteria bacterium]|nr:D-glycerate dehydrogenase [Pseudomonadota bacterium]
MKPRVFVTRQLPGPGLEMLNEKADVEIWSGDDPPPRDVIIDKIGRIDGLLCLLTDHIDAEIIGAAGQNLKVISNYAVGYDNIDITAATSRRIPVGNTPGVLTETTADLAFSLMMAAARRIVEGADLARAGKWRSWSPTLLLGEDIHHRTLGILGMGRIGRAMATRAHGFNMDVIFHTANPNSDAPANTRRVTFDELLAESDFLSLHVPLTDATHHIIDRDSLRKMKKTAILINTSRGPAVNHTALHDALEENQIAYAALDVTEPEPLPPGHKLYPQNNCLIVPHLGSASVATRSKMAEMATLNLIAGLQNKKLPNCVNEEVYR